MSILPGKLLDELQAAGLDVRSISPTDNADGVIAPHVTVVVGQGSILWGSVPTAQQEAAALAVVAAHDPTDYATAQRDSAGASYDAYLAGLRQLSPFDATFVVWARRRFVNEGGTVANAVAAITTANEAEAYWLSLPVVQAMTAAQRAHFGRDLKTTIELLAVSMLRS